MKFKLKDSFENFVYKALSAIVDIISTKAKNALTFNELAVILFDFPQVDELLHMADYHDKLGLPVSTLICLLEMHGHISHPETMLDPLESTDK